MYNFIAHSFFRLIMMYQTNMHSCLGFVLDLFFYLQSLYRYGSAKDRQGNNAIPENISLPILNFYTYYIVKIWTN